MIIDTYEAMAVYEKIWKIIRLKIDDNVTCDYLTDQIMDVINDNLQEIEEYINQLNYDFATDEDV